MTDAITEDDTVPLDVDDRTLSSEEIDGLLTHQRVASGLRTGLGARPDQPVSFVQSFDAAWAEELSEWLDTDES